MWWGSSANARQPRSVLREDRANRDSEDCEDVEAGEMWFLWESTSNGNGWSSEGAEEHQGIHHDPGSDRVLGHQVRAVEQGDPPDDG